MAEGEALALAAARAFAEALESRRSQLTPNQLKKARQKRSRLFSQVCMGGSKWRHNASMPAQAAVHALLTNGTDWKYAYKCLLWFYVARPVACFVQVAMAAGEGTVAAGKRRLGGAAEIDEPEGSACSHPLSLHHALQTSPTPELPKPACSDRPEAGATTQTQRGTLLARPLRPLQPRSSQRAAAIGAIPQHESFRQQQMQQRSDLSAMCQALQHDPEAAQDQVAATASSHCSDGTSQLPGALSTPTTTAACGGAEVCSAPATGAVIPAVICSRDVPLLATAAAVSHAVAATSRCCRSDLSGQLLAMTHTLSGGSDPAGSNFSSGSVVAADGIMPPPPQCVAASDPAPVSGHPGTAAAEQQHSCKEADAPELATASAGDSSEQQQQPRSQQGGRRKRAFVYGNYHSYYGYRTGPSGHEDPRLKVWTGLYLQLCSSGALRCGGVQQGWVGM